MIAFQNVQKDYRFQAEIDDPNISNGTLAKDIVVCPVFASDQDYTEDCKPLAVILLINKLPTKEQQQILSIMPNKLFADAHTFKQPDIDKLERVSTIMGRCFNSVNMIEQLHALHSVSMQVAEVNNQLGSHVEQSQIAFEGM